MQKQILIKFGETNKNITFLYIKFKNNLMNISASFVYKPYKIMDLIHEHKRKEGNEII